MAPSSNRHRLALLVSLALLLGAATAPWALADPGPKIFSADVTPTCVPAGSSVTFTATIRNESPTETIGSGRVFAPVGFTITAIVTPPAVGTATFESSAVHLDHIDVAPGGSVSVEYQATTATQGAYVWHVAAKRSGDFQGPPADDFSFRGAGSHVDVFVDTCVLHFVHQPANADAGANVTAEASDPAGTPVAVEVLEAADGARVETFDGAVSLELIAPDGVEGAALSPAVPSTDAVGGLATFDAAQGDGFSITPAGIGYRIEAVAGPGIAPVTSEPFDVAGTGQVVCTGAECSIEVVSDNGVTVEVAAPDAEAGDVITVALNVEGLECPGYEPLAGTPIVTFTVTGASIRVIKMRVPAELATRPIWRDHVCYSSVLPFLDRTGALVNTGVLPSCVKDPFEPPCQLPSRVNKRTGEHVIMFLAPPGSTKGRT